MNQSIEGNEENGQQTANNSVREEYFPYLYREKDSNILPNECIENAY